MEIAQGVMNELRGMALEAYEKFIGLRLADVAVDCRIVLHPEKATWGGEKAGRSPVVDRGKWGIKRSTAVDAEGIPLGTIMVPATRHDSPLLGETLDALEALGQMPERVRAHFDHNYDSETTHKWLEDRGLDAVISQKHKPAPLQATKRWVVERTNSSWNNAHKKKLVWCTERREPVVDFWVAFSEVVIIVGRLVRKA